MLNKDVPQWLLDIFNKIDFTKVPAIVKKMSLSALEKWADSNLKPYTKDSDFNIPPKRIIKKGFDTDLLRIINKYQYSYLNSQDKKLISDYLNKMIKTMPGH